MAELRWGSASHEGLQRSQNEDNLHAGDGLFVVADGMGGHLAGEVASEMTIDRLVERLGDDGEHTLDQLVAAINEANVEIYDASGANPEQAGMGTTVTAIAVVADPHDGEALGVANVGDSRSYVLRHGRLRQVTIDHSFVQELVAEGAITRDEARTHPRRNIVTRALGIEPFVRVDSWTMPIIRGDRFLLCSDGLSDYAPDDDITEILLAHPDDPDAAARALVDAANDGGGGDNITVVIVDVLAGDEPPDPTEEFDVLPLWSDDGEGDDTAETQIISDPPDDEHATPPAGTPAIAAGGAGAATSLYDGGDDVPPVPGALTPDTATAATSDAAAAGDGGGADGDGKRGRGKRRGTRLVRFVLALGVAAVLVLGFAILAAWARSGYFVAFDDEGTVVIYQGQQDQVLWFEPTREATGQYTRDELDENSVELVELRPEFESQVSAARFVAERLTPTTTSTTTTTTTVPTTEPPDAAGRSAPPTTAALGDEGGNAPSTATTTTAGG